MHAYTNMGMPEYTCVICIVMLFGWVRVGKYKYVWGLTLGADLANMNKTKTWK